MHDPTPPPKPTGQRKELSLTGCLLPYLAGQPVLLDVPGCQKMFVPVFSSIDKLRRSMKSIPYDAVKMIQDGPEFLSSIPGSLTVVLDIRQTEDGKSRWHEVLRD